MSTAVDRVRLYFAACGHGTPDQLRSHFADEAVIYDNNVKPLRGPNAIAAFWPKVRAKYGGAQWFVDTGVESSSGRACVVEWTMTGHIDGHFTAARGSDHYEFDDAGRITVIRQWWRPEGMKEEKGAGLQGFPYGRLPVLPSGELHDMRIERHEGYAILKLVSAPVNSMGLEFWEQFIIALDILEATETLGVVITSGLDRPLFTAGLDINELHVPSTSPQRFNRFWHAVTEGLVRVYESPMVTVCAVRGACPAGGCGLALACDHRIASEDCKIGLNEVALGIAVPPFWTRLMEERVGKTAAEGLLLDAKIVGASVAHTLGLVDQVVPGEELASAAAACVAEKIKMPAHARRAVKRQLRGRFAQQWRAGERFDADSVWAGISRPETVAQLTTVKARLSGSKGGGQKQAPKSSL